MINEENYRIFLSWEQRLRGWDVFDCPVEIEPIYQEIKYAETSIEDDGKFRLFKRKKMQKLGEEIFARAVPYPLNEAIVSFEIFVDENSLSQDALIQFLISIGETQEPLTFEIQGTAERISFRIVCQQNDARSVKSLLTAYFGSQVKQESPSLFSSIEVELGIIEFGLYDDISKPILDTKSNFQEPLIPILSLLEDIKEGEYMLFQIQFKGAEHNWKASYAESVLNGGLEGIYSDESEAITHFEQKFSSYIYSSRIRLVVCAPSPIETVSLSIRGVQALSVLNNGVNALMPLSNEGIGYEEHLLDIQNRTFHRPGFIFSLAELASFVRVPPLLPNLSKLQVEGEFSIRVPLELTRGKYLLGNNMYEGEVLPVCVNDDQRLKHHFILGSTGVGKSTYIVSQVVQDIHLGNGCTVIDPHGDLIDDILKRIPEERLEDVIIFDPSDSEFPVGFNLLQANSEAETIILNSDLISVFKDTSSSWGDQMTSILSNALAVFLERSETGTLLELQYFLRDERYRNRVLKEVKDPIILNYWKKEFSELRKGTLSPILTRLGTFLRPKLIRNIMAIKDGLNVSEILEGQKIFLVKLSQGMIGEDNSQMLGKLVLSKVYQSALGRQNILSQERHPHYLYIDEFHNFISSTFIGIVTGVRKYGLGLTCACQNLVQLKKVSGLQEIMLSNAFIRTVFRVGDDDGVILTKNNDGFGSFELTNLGRGKTVVRIGRAQNSCTLETFITKATREDLTDLIEANRQRYSKEKIQVEEIISLLYESETINREVERSIEKIVDQDETAKTEEKDSKSFVEQKLDFHEKESKKQRQKEHTKMLNSIKELAQNLGWKAQTEYPVTGGRVDVYLENGTKKVAVEVSFTNIVDYEVQNILKCIHAGFEEIIFISADSVKRSKVKESLNKKLTENYNLNVSFLTDKEFIHWLQSNSQKEDEVENIGGYKVKTSYQFNASEEELARRIMEILSKRS